MENKKQVVVSQSSVEVECWVMAKIVSEILWLCWFLKDLDIFVDRPMPLFCDNQAARHTANNLVFLERTKHVDMDCYFL